MYGHEKRKFNPTPISIFLVTIFFGVNVGTDILEIFKLLIVVFFSILFAINGRKSTAIKVVIFYIVVAVLSLGMNMNLPIFVRDYLLMLALAIKLFFLPFLSGKFLIATSDVSSMIISMEKMKIPRVIVIPIAVMFRYFPAFKDDKKNIKRAMKMRRITFKNPVRYFEYVSVPIIISATNIADDISKAAETKCIGDPCKKTRYFEVKFGIPDIVFLAVILFLHTLGRIYG